MADSLYVGGNVTVNGIAHVDFIHAKDSSYVIFEDQIKAKGQFPMRFEGLTEDDNYMNFQAVDFTSPRSVVLQDGSGIMVLENDKECLNLEGDNLSIDGNGVLNCTETDPTVDAVITKGLYIENPIAADDLKSIFRNMSGSDYTITKIWGESDQTVSFDLQVDDGTPADVSGTDINPVAGEDEITSLAGDTTLGVNEKLDLVINSVANTPTWLSIMWSMVKN